jgi:hypothetical protein
MRSNSPHEAPNASTRRNACPEIAEWLSHTWQWGKNMKVGQPISVSLQADISQLRKCQDFSDLFMIHPYVTVKAFLKLTGFWEWLRSQPYCTKPGNMVNQGKGGHYHEENRLGQELLLH